ncbi:uncharacterized protein MELLADRAFT_88192 [Melampsora larici-populina 98AG31]|uniref:Uncharacterized protein n=1 Tax=Melampsora larici-populina (strain 98AG31 / pathotype 3-4-7) TaxID=747676 RepID=F4RQW7_MELLP|nr:uncharacterized protein MELLADRAFT_88192 [Melampsora larici-populina 98AG31]EGG05112.1 hypothetical protein MELLADRAFT_88192 [Melampsora larici-populina 98AG31]
MDLLMSSPPECFSMHQMTTPPEAQDMPTSVHSTPQSTQSLPRSVFSTSCSIFGGSPPQYHQRSISRNSASDDQSLHNESVDEADTTIRGLTRTLSVVSIPIFFVNKRSSSGSEAVGLGFDHLDPTPKSNQILTDSSSSHLVVEANSECARVSRNLSTSSTSTTDSEGSLRRLSTYSGLTTGSTASSFYTEPPTPSDGTFAASQPGGHSNPIGHERENSESSAFSISAYYGSSDCTEETPIETLNTLLAPIDICHIDQQPILPPSPLKTIIPTLISTPPTDRTPTQASPKKSSDSADTPRTKFKPKQRKLFGNEYRWPAQGEKSGVSVQLIDPPCPPDALVHTHTEFNGPTDFHLAQSYQKSTPIPHLKISVPTGLDQRRGSPPHAPLRVVPFPQENSRELDIESARTALTNHNIITLVQRPSLECISPSSSSTMCQQVLHPSTVSPSFYSNPSTAVSFQQPRTDSNVSQYAFPTSQDHDSSDLPVGELFRTLQIWFDQEGFREIAPIFTFDRYNPEDDLLYFTTQRVGYPFHYTTFQQLPALRKVVAPDYEEAYALLEGKSSRNAAGRRDFLSRQASLDMKTPGKYVVEDTEGKGGKWIWRLVYEVEDRKSLMGKPMAGERAFIPITFACSPEILDPSHARKPTLMNAIMKNMGSKTLALALDADGRPKPRPRGKSLMGHQRRDRSDSSTRLIGTSPRYPPSSNSSNCELVPSPQTPKSNKTSAGTQNDDELSRAQAHFFKTISPASSSRLRPNTAQATGDPRRSLRRPKTSEHLRRPVTADPFAPPLPTRPIITPVFGLAPQPTRETPNTMGNRFNYRPKTADQRRPVTPKAKIDIQRIAAASLFHPVDLRH